MKCAIYCRLSKEDGGEFESESIQNQRSLLLKYALDRDWEVFRIYSDEDYSGIAARRPAFDELISDAEKRLFDIVLCKTQSRFTRDMEQVERYIHKLFPLWGIRFIAVADNADTAVKGNKKARQIAGLVNEWYLEDLSENIRAVLDHKRKEGVYIGSFPLYGYKKSPEKGKLEIDPEAAGTVRYIFTDTANMPSAKYSTRPGYPIPPHTRPKKERPFSRAGGRASRQNGTRPRFPVYFPTKCMPAPWSRAGAER